MQESANVSDKGAKASAKSQGTVDYCAVVPVTRNNNNRRDDLESNLVLLGLTGKIKARVNLYSPWIISFYGLSNKLPAGFPLFRFISFRTRVDNWVPLTGLPYQKSHNRPIHSNISCTHIIMDCIISYSSFTT